jgi:hypothetical protein
VPQVPLVSHGNLPHVEGEAEAAPERHTESSSTQQKQTGDARSTDDPSTMKSPAVNVASSRDRASQVVHKGSYRGSPVVSVRLATEVNPNTVKALRSVGPSDFQAVREIGQGAFGKVGYISLLLQTHTPLHALPGVPKCSRPVAQLPEEDVHRRSFPFCSQLIHYCSSLLSYTTQKEMQRHSSTSSCQIPHEADDALSV